MACPLCLEDKDVVSSHLIPQAMYNYCRAGDSEPVIMTSKVVMQTSRQAQHPLLCQGCEDVLNKGGENWLLPLLATVDGKFPLLDIIERFEPNVVDGELRAYAASRNPAIETDKLIHFAMGVFWKASIHSWKGDSREPQIELGSYRESVRTFLLGKTPFPQRMGLVLLKPDEHFEQRFLLQDAFSFDQAGDYQITFSTVFSVLVGEKDGPFAGVCPIRIPATGGANLVVTGTN